MYCELAIPSGLFVCLLSTLYRQPDIVTEYVKMNYKTLNARTIEK